MDFRSSERIAGPSSEDVLPPSTVAAVKVVIVGGFGVGKTTLVGSVSEIRPLTTEETMTQAAVGVDDIAGVERKTATTVAMDFGRISLDQHLVLYLFGTPGQQRFWFLWSGLFE
jgi:signal recognition particle receptor subunit beta